MAGLWESRAEKGTKSLYLLSEGGGKDAGLASAEDRGFHAGASEHNSSPVLAGAL